MSKIEFNANARIYQGEFRRNVQVEPSAALFGLQPAMPGRETRLDAMSEEALAVILREYDGNGELTVSGDTALFPEYMQTGLSDVFANLKRAGMLDGFTLDMSRWSAVLTPAGLGYFDDERKTPAGEAGFKKLPPNSEKLLLVLVESDNPEKMLWERYNSGGYEELKELSAILRELAGAGYIRIPVWKDDIPRYVEISDAARAYLDREYETISPDLSAPPVQKDELKQYDVFLSHAGRDRSVYADGLYASLSRLGVSILYDRSIFPGRRLEGEINRRDRFLGIYHPDNLRELFRRRMDR